MCAAEKEPYLLTTARMFYRTPLPEGRKGRSTSTPWACSIGVVERYYGIYDFQDAVPPGTEVPPQPLYAVRFDARELWGASAEAHSVVCIDMWESYLEPA